MNLPPLLMVKISVNLSTLKSPKAAIMPPFVSLNTLSVTSVRLFDVHKTKLIHKSDILIRSLRRYFIFVVSRDFSFPEYGTPLKTKSIFYPRHKQIILVWHNENGRETEQRLSKNKNTKGVASLRLNYLVDTRGAVVQWLARPLVTPAARVRSSDQEHY